MWRMTLYTGALVVLTTTHLNAVTALAGETAIHSPELRHDHEISREVRATLRQIAQSRGTAEHSLAVVQLIDLHNELRNHPHLKKRPSLTNLMAITERQLARIGRRLHRANGPQHVPDQLGALRQLGILVPAGNGPLPFAAIPNGQVPNGAGNAVVGNGGPGFVAGADLVELIQRTIAPASWDVNGGPNAIVYFTPGRALVVRAR